VLTEKENKELRLSLEMLGQNFSVEQIENLSTYLFELDKWNRTYNLTGFKGFRENLVKNLLDCLSVRPFINEDRLLDLGTGAGLPGILLAMLNAEQNWVLLDGNGKKTRFLQNIKQRLSLDNIEVVNKRAEEYKTEAPFNGISSRAFDKIPSSLSLCEHLLANNSLFFAMKGVIREEEINNLPAWAKLESIKEIKVPKLNEQRHLIVINCKHEN
jgi:16S rRNA (guanine527-N7)-methyltransferase